MRRRELLIGLGAMAGLAGCGAFPGGESDGEATADEGVAVEDDAAGTADVAQTLRIEVDETAADTELTAIGATYPRDAFVVDSAQHDAITLGVDTDGDGDAEETFDETHVSGVNNNAYSFDVTLDTGYALEEGDVVVIGYPSVTNPDEPGEYEVEMRLNGESTATDTVTIE